MKCPRCDEIIYPFGKKGEGSEKKFPIPYFDSMPIDSALATLRIEGKIEDYEGRCLEKINSAIHGLKDK